MLSFPLFYSTFSWWKFPTFMSVLPIMGLYFRKLLFISKGENIQHYTLAHLVLHKFSNDIYKLVRGGRNIQHSMLDFHQENTALQQNILQGILPTFVFRNQLFLYSFGSWCTYGIYSQQYMLAFPIFYSTLSQWKLPTFMLALPLLDLYFCISKFMDEVWGANIIC